MLYLVATPIGNLSDITLRAIETLKNCELILAEDTRRTGILLKRYDIANRMESFNDNNKEIKTKRIVPLLKQEKDIALVSDSGTPGISDPGFYLTRECIREQIAVSPIPGASAFISALIASGLPTDRFAFYGFLPKKPGKLKKILEEIKIREETSIFYESPHRIRKVIDTMCEVIPGRTVVLAREITKKFEEFIRGTPAEIREMTKEHSLKGEFVVLIGKK
ncbi:MAG: 16S rRNA (cytidine(1402)-2'-O)-methyltransferase [Nanoarchaeota archaeon]|nr:16S rRNA (cytidine(1402)-2'-O)-methyltransferase [Nanoarchaeota archaeon]